MGGSSLAQMKKKIYTEGAEDTEGHGEEKSGFLASLGMTVWVGDGADEDGHGMPAPTGAMAGWLGICGGVRR